MQLWTVPFALVPHTVCNRCLLASRLWRDTPQPSKIDGLKLNARQQQMCRVHLTYPLLSHCSPPPLQVPPTVDNMLENVVSLTAAALGLPPDALLNTHRLDVGTSGVVLMAKSPGFAAWFSALLKNKPGALVKTYRCLTSTPPPLGPMVHWAVVEHRAAGEPAHTRMLLECSVPDPQQGSSSSSGGDDDGGCGGKDAGACSGSGLGAGGSSSQRSVGAAQGAVEGAARCELIVEQVRPTPACTHAVST